MSISGLESRLTAGDLQGLLAVTRALAAPFDLRSMLNEVTAAACRVLHAERASVWLLDAAAQELAVEIASDLQPLRVPVGVGFVGICAAQRIVVNVPDCYADPRFNSEIDKQSGFHTRCLITVPLIDHRSELIGVMQVLNRDQGVFDAGDEVLAQALAAQCAVALSRVRMTAELIEGELMRQELHLASQAQQSTLPKAWPELPGYEMHAHFQPAAQTGGDTYDLGRVEQGLLLVLADATGHGLAPALSVIQMQAMLRMAFSLGASLEQAFRQVNDQLCQSLRDGHFVTAFIGLLDPQRHRLRFLSGGQGPILHFKAAAAQCAAYRATSFPMGAMPIQTLKPAIEIELAPGDWLVLLSDGIYESVNPEGQQFGRGRIEALMQRLHAGSPAQACAAILDALRDFARGAPQDDDITLVLLKRSALHEGACVIDTSS